MSDQFDRKLAEIAAQFDEKIARLDAATATRPPPSDRAPAGRSMLDRFRSSPKTAPWDAVTQRLEDLKRFRTSLLRKAQAARANADEWERRAMLCVKAGNDDLAREALSWRHEALDEAADLDARTKQIDDVLPEFQLAIDEIKRTVTGS